MFEFFTKAVYEIKENIEEEIEQEKEKTPLERAREVLEKCSKMEYK